MSVSGLSGSWPSAAQTLLSTLETQSGASSVSTASLSAATLSSLSSASTPAAAFTPQAAWPFSASADAMS